MIKKMTFLSSQWLGKWHFLVLTDQENDISWFSTIRKMTFLSSHWLGKWHFLHLKDKEALFDSENKPFLVLKDWKIYGNDFLFIGSFIYYKTQRWNVQQMNSINTHHWWALLNKSPLHIHDRTIRPSFESWVSSGFFFHGRIVHGRIILPPSITPRSYSRFKDKK